MYLFRMIISMKMTPHSQVEKKMKEESW